MILKVLTSNSPKSALTSLLNKATDSPNLKSRDIGMPSTSRNDTERDSGLKIVNQNNVTTSESSKLLQTIEEKKWNHIFIRILSVTQRENVMKELISKSFIEKQCKTCRVKHPYQTVGAVNVQELNKKTRSLVIPSELRRLFNKKNDFLNIFLDQMMSFSTRCILNVYFAICSYL